MKEIVLIISVIFGLLLTLEVLAGGENEAYLVNPDCLPFASSGHTGPWVFLKQPNVDGETLYYIYTNIFQRQSDNTLVHLPTDEQILWQVDTAKRIKDPNTGALTAIRATFFGDANENPAEYPPGYPLGQTLIIHIIEVLDLSKIPFIEKGSQAAPIK